MGKVRKSGLSSPIAHSRSAAPFSRRPSVFALTKTPSNEDLLTVLRTSLAASTPSPLAGYREAPPSSNASSCDTSHENDFALLDDDDAPDASPTEWEAWIDWHKCSNTDAHMAMASMRLA